MFVGEYDRSVDGNGRLALPAAFRDDLGSHCYVTSDPDGCVAITTVESFESDAARVMDDVRNGLLPRSAQREFAVKSIRTAVDKQGRLTLDEDVRHRAGIVAGGQVRVAGMLDRLEIWRPSRYETVRGEDAVEQPSRDWGDEESAE